MKRRHRSGFSRCLPVRPLCPSRECHTLRQACEKFPRRGAVGCRYNPPQLNTGPSSLTPCRCVRVPCRRALFRRASPRLLRNRPPARTGCTKSSMTGSGSSPVRTGNWCGSTGPKTAGLTRLASPLSLGYAPLVLCPQVRLSDGTTGAGCDGTTAGGLAGSTTGRKTYSVFAIHSN